MYVSYFVNQKNEVFKMDITSIKEKYLFDINKNYVPKTAVEARLGIKTRNETSTNFSFSF